MCTVVIAVLIGVPTDLIDTPIFGRSIAPTWWAYPVWVLSSVLAGLLVTTYVRPAGDRVVASASEQRWGGLGGLLGFLAVGCPVCNKLVLVALGTSGALSIFQPLQPVLAIASVALLGWALRHRLSGQTACSTVASRQE